MTQHLMPRGQPGRKPGDGRGVMREGSLPSRLLAFIEANAVAGYDDLLRVFNDTRLSHISRSLSYLVSVGRIRRVGRGMYARMQDAAHIRSDGCLALLVHGRAVVLPPPVVEQLREVLR